MFKFSNALDSIFLRTDLAGENYRKKNGELALSVVLIRVYVCEGIPLLPVFPFDSKLLAFLIKAITAAMKISSLYFVQLRWHA